MSKRVFNHPAPPAEGDSVSAWRSLGEKEASPRFRQELDREFPAGSSEMDEAEREMSRRSFTKLMGASSALAGLGLASCRRAASYIVPYKDAPEWVVPGKPLFYATSLPRPDGALPVVVTTYEGRPTKIEPNPDHPDANGADAFAQASILDLYAPNRSQQVLYKNQTTTLGEFRRKVGVLTGNLAKTAFIFGTDHSPTRNRIAKKLAGKGATLAAYEPLTGEGRRKAMREAFGADTTLTVDFAKADKILSLDCDFLGTDPTGSHRAFSDRRQGGNADYKGKMEAGKMNRLYQVESAFSLTGGMADHRLRARPSQILRVAGDIASALGVTTSITASGDDHKSFFPGASDAAGLYKKWISACAADLKEGNAVVLAGSRHDAALHHLVVQMNQALGAFGISLQAHQTGAPDFQTIDQLQEALTAGEVENVVFLTPADPVYDAPGFRETLKKAKVSVHFGTRTSATARVSTWHIPAAHALESWSDTRSATGVYSVSQPLIDPLYGAISEIELLLLILNGTPVKKIEKEAAATADGESKPDSEAAEDPAMAVAAAPEVGDVALAEVKETFAEIAGSLTPENWTETLKNGFLGESAFESAAAPSAKAVSAPETAASGLEIIFAADASVWDGRYIDNAWLQEAPDPVTKLTWDNAALVSPQTAKDLGIYDHLVAHESKTAAVPEIGEGAGAAAPLVKLSVNGKSLVVPVLVAFGQADGVLSLALGYGQAADDGREGAEKFDTEIPTVGDAGLNTGFNAYRLRTTKTPYFASGLQVEMTGAEYPVALTQEHHAMYGRAIAREISTNEVAGKGDFTKQLEKVKKQGIDSHVPENVNLYKPKGSELWADKFGPSKKAAETHLWDDLHQWGMTIDLNTCTGCNACLVACQAENNIPVVGKTQVAMGREMHWIRMDRYYASRKHELDDHGHYQKDEEKKKVSTPDWVSANPEMIPQPVACVQCEQAPCETVCPVNATVHTAEGLNAMAYNRCIGTRYCANNCPYKARRFNYFDYNKRNPLIKKNLYRGPFGKKQEGTAQQLQRNPNVTVRMRGVMEKCTYCVQRLESAKIKQKQQVKYEAAAAGVKSVEYHVDRVSDLRIKTDSVKTACQDACPSGAIAFGNLLAEDSIVSRAKKSPRNYDLLNYINTRPRTSYLARVKNPNPQMPDAKYLGQATIHIH